MLGNTQPMPSEIHSPGHYPDIYKKYLIEKKSKRLIYKNTILNVCRTGEVFLDGNLLERSWNGEKKDFIIHIPKPDKTCISVYFKKLCDLTYAKRN